jgi:hypothetical protein
MAISPSPKSRLCHLSGIASSRVRGDDRRHEVIDAACAAARAAIRRTGPIPAAAAIIPAASFGVLAISPSLGNS